MEFVSNDLITSKSGNRKYFVVVLSTDKKEHRIVSFDCDRLGFFKSLQKKDDVGCSINSVQKSGDDFIFNSKSTAKECVPSFKKTKIPKLITSLMDIKLKCKVYDKVNVCIKVIALSDVTEASDSKSSVPYQTATVADSGESRTLTVYARLINTLEVNKCFKITDLNVVDF